MGMVSAWSSEAGLVLGQRKYDFQDNHEKYAVNGVIDMLDLKGTVISLDANGACQDIFNAVRAKDADFVIGLKRNMRNLFKLAEVIFEINRDKQISIERVIQSEEGHGREEERIYELIEIDRAEFSRLPSRQEAIEKYPQVKSLGRVTRKTKRYGTETLETHYYLVSFSQDRVDDFARSVRSHWQIENKLHWILDVAFNEDRATIRMKYAAENVAVMRRLAFNLLKQESTQIGMRAKRMKAAWDVNYLLKILVN